jgi:hypothetical protein
MLVVILMVQDKKTGLAVREKQVVADSGIDLD